MAKLRETRRTPRPCEMQWRGQKPRGQKREKYEAKEPWCCLKMFSRAHVAQYAQSVRRETIFER